MAGGNKQHDFISKVDVSSPKVSTKAVMLTCVVHAEEDRDVAIVDIPNALIQTRWVHVTLSRSDERVV